MDVILVARSIGRRSLSDPLSGEGHAGLVLDLGTPAASYHWIVQAGPVDGLLLGTLTHARTRPGRTPSPWGEARSGTAAAILPVSLLLRQSAPSVDRARLAAIVGGINERRLVYRYETGPNSNTFVRMVLEGMAGPVPALPDGGLALRGWQWESPDA